MYLVIRKYYTISRKGEEWRQRVQAGLVPLLQEMPGFHAYYALQVRDPDAEQSERADTRYRSSSSPCRRQYRPPPIKQDLIRPGTYAKSSKPYVSRKGGISQEALIDVWIQEDGKSQYH